MQLQEMMVDPLVLDWARAKLTAYNVSKEAYEEGDKKSTHWRILEKDLPTVKEVIRLDDLFRYGPVEKPEPVVLTKDVYKTSWGVLSMMALIALILGLAIGYYSFR